jgi:chromosome partitioning protein
MVSTCAPASHYDVLVGKPRSPTSSALAVPRLDIAPARIFLKLASWWESSMRPAPDRLQRSRTATLRDLDTPPALGLITVNALVAATHLLIPVQSSYFALEGTDDLLETVDRIRARPNPDLKLLGAVITLHDKRTTLSRDVQKAITEVFGGRVFETTISKSIRLEESPAHRESIFTFAPQSSGAYEYYKLCEEVIERV